MLADNVVVAVQAFFHRRYSRIDGAAHIGVAELTLNFFYAGMQLVTERYGLFRADVKSRGRIVIEINPSTERMQAPSQRLVLLCEYQAAINSSTRITGSGFTVQVASFQNVQGPCHILIGVH